MSDQSLILLDLQALSCKITPKADELKTAALESSALIARVADPDEQRVAVLAQGDLAAVIKLVSDAEEAAKKPLNALRKQIIDTSKEFLEELKAEEWRLSRLVGDYQQLEQAKAIAAQKAENERLSQVERDRAAALAKATTHEELDAVQEEFNQRAQEAAPPIAAPPRAKGQVVKADWEVTVSDVWALARAHPGCVRIEPLLGNIKDCLNAGLTLPGVTGTKITKSSVRTSSKAITVN